MFNAGIFSFIAIFMDHGMKLSFRIDEETKLQQPVQGKAVPIQGKAKPVQGKALPGIMLEGRRTGLSSIRQLCSLLQTHC